MIGRTLGHYEIVDRLGAGGMGEVYLAEDTELERRVALKILPPDMAAEPERLERFRREAKAVAKLNHTNIVTIYTVEEAEGLRFFTMELVKGYSLEELIPSDGLELDVLLDYAIPLAAGLAAAHARGITHRDLKPSNVMVDEEGEVKILDFGLAKLEPPGDEADLSRLATATMTGEGTVLGTMPYMSPEQVEGKRLDARSDVFSLGILLYEMATGERPFSGDSPARLVSSILKDRPRPLGEVRRGLPAAFGEIVARCLEKDPGTRYPSADAVLADLEQLRDRLGPGTSLGVGGRKLPFAAVRPGRRLWAVVTLAALVAVVALAVVLGRRAAAPEAGGSAISSLAVLPLDNLSGDPSQDYFADGLTELLITDLSKIGSLKVISRTSAMRFKGSTQPLPEIAEILDVDAVVEGSVLRAGDEVRITAQLIDARADEHLWAESYQRRLEDVLGIQAEVARAIARQIEVTLTPEEMARLDTQRTVDPEALDAYLEGRDLWKHWGPHLAQSIPHFLRAIEIDPDYALAHAGLADAYLVLAHFARPAEEAMPLAKQSALRALEIDPYLAEAHTSLADTVFHYEWDWERAEEEFERALELNPGYAIAHAWYSGLLAALGRHDEAVRQIEQARELEPLNYPIQAFGVRVLAWAGRHDQALRMATALRERFPEASPETYAMALAINDRPVPGDILAALEHQAETVTLPYPKAALAVALAGSGQESLARRLLDDLESAYRTTYVSPYMIAQARALLGETDAALSWLEEALERRAADLVWIAVEPAFERLRDEGRFRAVVTAMQFPRVGERAEHRLDQSSVGSGLDPPQANARIDSSAFAAETDSGGRHPPCLSRRPLSSLGPGKSSR